MSSTVAEGPPLRHGDRLAPRNTAHCPPQTRHAERQGSIHARRASASADPEPRGPSVARSRQPHRSRHGTPKDSSHPAGQLGMTRIGAGRMASRLPCRPTDEHTDRSDRDGLDAARDRSWFVPTRYGHACGGADLPRPQTESAASGSGRGCRPPACWRMRRSDPGQTGGASWPRWIRSPAENIGVSRCGIVFDEAGGAPGTGASARRDRGSGCRRSPPRSPCSMPRQSR